MTATTAEMGVSPAQSPTPARKKNNYFDGLAVTGRHKLVFVLIMIAYFFEQMDNWNFGFVAPAIFQSWGLTAAQSNEMMAKIVLWYFIGMTAGGILGGVISDAIGRRKTFLLAIFLFSCSSIVNGLPIESHTVFIAARALTGFGVFCLMVCSQTYIAEMAPAESRGKWQGMVAAVGFCAVPVIAGICSVVLPLHPEAWRYIFYLGGTGLIALVVAIKYLDESPRWLMARGRLKEAEFVVKDITRQDIDLSDVTQTVQKTSNPVQAITGMFGREYIGRTVLLFLIFVAITPAGFTFTSWTTKLLASIPAIDPATGLEIIDQATGKVQLLFDPTTVQRIMVAISCGVPLGCFLASRIADLGGRKIPLALMFGGAALSALLFAFFHNSAIQAGLFGFLLSVFNMAGGFILFTYTAESYPTRMRNTASGLHNGVARLSVSAFQPMIPVILATFGGTVGLINYDIPAVFVSCAIMFAVSVPLILIFGARTGGKSLEEIS